MSFQGNQSHVAISNGEYSIQKRSANPTMDSCYWRSTTEGLLPSLSRASHDRIGISAESRGAEVEGARRISNADGYFLSTIKVGNFGELHATSPCFSLELSIYR
jgi:hypothetical protein